MPRKAVKPSDPVIAKAKPTPKKKSAKKKAPRRPKPAKPSPRWPAGKDVELAEKRDKILDLRANGATIRQIADHLRNECLRDIMQADPELTLEEAEAAVNDGTHGVSKSRIHQVLEEALDEYHAISVTKTQRLVNLELYKLDQAELSIFANLKRIADIDKNILKGYTEAAARQDISLLTALSKSGFYSDDVDKYSRSLERIWKRRDALLGLNKPVKHEHSGQDGKPIQTEVVTRVILPTIAEPVTEEEEGNGV